MLTCHHNHLLCELDGSFLVFVQLYGIGTSIIIIWDHLRSSLTESNIFMEIHVGTHTFLAPNTVFLHGTVYIDRYPHCIMLSGPNVSILIPVISA